jgi:uridine nucleosidase
MTAMPASLDKIPLWLDCDPGKRDRSLRAGTTWNSLTGSGHDDACAILFAAYHPNLELLGISTVYGNAPLEKTTKNALAVLEAIGKLNTPVFPGASNPFCRTVHTAGDIHGKPPTAQCST